MVNLLEEDPLVPLLPFHFKEQQCFKAKSYQIQEEQ